METRKSKLKLGTRTSHFKGNAAASYIRHYDIRTPELGRAEGQRVLFALSTLWATFGLRKVLGPGLVAWAWS